MTKLVETRAEYAAQLEALQLRKKNEIEEKVAAYRAQLEATQFAEDVEIDKLDKIVTALDNLISIETPAVSSTPTSRPQIEEQVLGRPGMSVFTVPRD